MITAILSHLGSTVKQSIQKTSFFTLIDQQSCLTFRFCSILSPMKIIGLTGGIGTGKSIVAGYFADLGVPIIDADVIAHQLVAKGMPALEAIKKTFGPCIIDTQGNLNRAKMRALVFTHHRNENPFKQKLESILHPLIYQEIKKQIDILQNTHPPFGYCVIVVPLLLEKWYAFKDIIDHILVVDLPEPLQVERLLKRHSNPPLTKAQALAIIHNQMQRAERLKMANTILPNSGNLEELHDNVHRLHALWGTI